MANNLAAREQSWCENLDLFDSWQDKYQFIMDCGRKLDSLPVSERHVELLVRGCQSQVWMDIKLENDLLFVKADSDALVVKGLIAILVDIYNAQKLCDIVEYDHKFAIRLGLSEHLSPTRANGLYAMLSKIKSEVHI